MLVNSRTPPFEFDVDMVGATAVITLSGELDLVVRSALREQLAEVADKKPDVVVIDLAAVTFLDCGTAAMTIQTSRLIASGRKPILRSLRPQVRRLLEVACLESQCELAGDPSHGILPSQES